MSDQRESISKRQWSDLFGTFFLAFGLLFAFALYAPASWTGWLGRALSTVSMGLFGTLAYFLPPVLLVFSLLYFMERAHHIKSLSVGALSLLFVLLSSVVSIASMSCTTLLQRLSLEGEGLAGFQVVRMLWMDGRFPERIRPGNIWSGGLLGGLISNGLERVAGVTGASILIAALILSVLVYAFGFSVRRLSLRRKVVSFDEPVDVDPMSSDELMSLEQPEERKGVFAFLKRRFGKKSDAEPAEGTSQDVLSNAYVHISAAPNDSDVPAIEASRTFENSAQQAKADYNSTSLYTYTPSQPDMSQINGSHNGSTVPQNGQVTSGPQGWDTLQYDSSSSAPHDPEEQVITYIAFPQPPQDHGINDATRLRPIGGRGRPYLFDATGTEATNQVEGFLSPAGDDISKENLPAGQLMPWSDDRRASYIAPSESHGNLKRPLVRSPISVQHEQFDGRARWEDRNTKKTQRVRPSSKKKPRHEQMSLLSEYKTPPLSLLKEDRGMKKTPEEIKEIRELGRKLEDTLSDFGVEARIVNYTTGPTITRFELAPGPGVKVSRIVNLSDDIALSLAAYGVRIEAPIPGKSAIGIEIPNRRTYPVLLRSLLQSKEFINAEGGLVTALGRDVGGEPILCDLTRMPHILIAGATGSGKSVCINSILISLLYRYGPDHVRFLMIDPKIVELSVYNSIPHLLQPVVTNPEKAYAVLNYAVSEMERRYQLFADARVRDISSYNDQKRKMSETIMASDDEDDNSSDWPLPYILIVIDELADLMAVTQHQVEDAISRLMAKARAVGIHVIIATQRPSVDVITGVIKANIPSRIAFAVASQVDSRTIIDTGGAEKLLGKGDMLYYPIGSLKAIRGQGSFVTNNEVERVLSFIKSYYPENYDEKVAEAIENPDKSADSKGFGGEGEDELLLDALRVVVETEYASVSLLQRKLQVGYPRAARMIDRLCEMGYVGPFEGSKPREVLITPDVYEQLMRDLDN